MIRRRSSFFISLVVHSFILLSILFLYNYVTPPKKEQRVPINLCQCMASGCTCNAKQKSQEETTTPVKQEKPIVEKQTFLKQKQEQEVAKKEIVNQNTIQESMPKKVIVQQDSVIVTQKSVIPPVVLAQQIPSKPLFQENKIQTPKISVQKQYVQTNFSAIKSMLQENFYYPLSARKRGIQGEVVVKFTLLKNSTIKDIIVTKTPHEILSDAAVKTIESLNGKLPAPSEELLLELPINYNLH